MTWRVRWWQRVWARLKTLDHEGTDNPDRGRLTIVDVVYTAVGLAAFGILMPPVWGLIDQNAGSLSTGAEYLFLMLPPALLVTLLTVVYATALKGAGG